jgi:peptide/nickel transport system permease protein
MKYFAKRILSVIPVLFVVSVIVFSLIHLAPGDPAKVMLGDRATVAQVEDLRKSMGLDLPLPLQYLNWIKRLLQGDLGESIFIKEPMKDIILNHLAPTVILSFYSLIFAVLIAAPLGVLAAKKRGTITDQIISTFSMSGISIPSFLLGLLLILSCGVWLKIAPVAGYKEIGRDGFLENLKYMALPSIALGFMEAGLLIRMTRSSVLDILSGDYIKMARSKGVSELSIVLKHALKNAALPILTSIGQSLIGLLSGAAVVEAVFNIPGIGQLMVNSITRRDYEVIQIAVLLTALINVLVCLIIDILYGLFDPKVRVGG